MSDATKFLLWLLLLLLLSTSSSCFGSERDIQCLKSVQKSVVDPNGVLKSMWNFENNDSISICSLGGVQCWNGAEKNRVLSLRLCNLGLEGPFPQGLQDCKSINGLDLSGNNFSGPIPSDIGFQMPYLISMDLSDNNFSRAIPFSIASMTYLTVLNLRHNQLSGRIPRQFSLLAQLTTFNVANNLLSGPIPPFRKELNSPWNFGGNQGLCGSPLDDCPISVRTRIPTRIRLHWINDESSLGAAVGFVAGFVVALYLPRCFVFSERIGACVFHMCDQRVLKLCHQLPKGH